MSKDNLTVWNGYWSRGHTEWQLDELNPAIQKYGHHWIHSDEKNLSIMFPLCGKSLDLKILADKGHITFGVEGVDDAVAAFGDANDLNDRRIDENTDQTPGFKINKFAEDKITIYQGDFFDWTKDPKDTNFPKFDRIFDRGSLVAIHPSKRAEYVKIINSMLKPGGKWLIYTMAYPQEENQAEPWSIDENCITNLLQDLKEEIPEAFFQLDVLETTPVRSDNVPKDFPPSVGRWLQSQGGPLSRLVECYFLLTKLE
eukprot:UN00927